MPSPCFDSDDEMLPDAAASGAGPIASALAMPLPPPSQPPQPPPPPQQQRHRRSSACLLTPVGDCASAPAVFRSLSEPEVVGAAPAVVDALTAALANSAHTIGRQLLRLSACRDVAAPAGDAAPVVPCNWRSAHHRVPSGNMAGGAAAGGAGGDDGVRQQLLLQANKLPHAAAVHCAVTRLQQPVPNQSSMQKQQRQRAGATHTRAAAALGVSGVSRGYSSSQAGTAAAVAPGTRAWRMPNRLGQVAVV